jgi:predicted methyltransferase
VAGQETGKAAMFAAIIAVNVAANVAANLAANITEIITGPAESTARAPADGRRHSGECDKLA